jgi:hypothetical protein
MQCYKNTNDLLLKHNCIVLRKFCNLTTRLALLLFASEGFYIMLDAVSF